MGHLLCSVVFAQKIKSRSSNFPSGYIHRRIEGRVLKRYLYTCVPSSIIHNSRNTEVSLVSTDGYGDKMWCKYTYNGIAFSFTREGHSSTCHDVDEH